MAGVWVFRDGVAKLVQNPLMEPIDGQEMQIGGGAGGGRPRKVLVYLPANQEIRSYEELEERLAGLGWRRYDDGEAGGGGGRVPGRLQFHRCLNSSLLISLPADFRNFKSMHMYDIVLKNRHHFEVRDLNHTN